MGQDEETSASAWSRRLRHRGTDAHKADQEGGVDIAKTSNPTGFYFSEECNNKQYQRGTHDQQQQQQQPTKARAT